MKSKYLSLLAASIFGASAGANANKLDSDGILRNDNGTIRSMNQYDATRACPRGTRLPTARELAKLSQAHGANGILEVGQVSLTGLPAGYYLVSAIDPTGRKDQFYFNYGGYKRPSGDLGNNWFWSSSIHSGYSYHGLYLSGDRGLLSNFNRGNYGAVRCVTGQ